jgi:uncharacterized integral membrane protein (TIGR00698 family)
MAPTSGGAEPSHHAAHGRAQHHTNIWPGLILTAVIAGASFARQLPGVSTFSPMILAIGIGIGFHNVIGTPPRAKAGVVFSLRKLLRFAIILLGLQLTAEQVMEVGATGIGVIALTLVGTFLFSTWLGRMLGVERKLSELIAAGTSICGVSAVIATNTVTGAHDEDVAYAVACVTVFGSIAMFVYPLLPGLLHLDPHAYGLWAGASIHEIAQVVAAAFQDGRKAGEVGTIAKLSRVMMLAPMVIALGLMAARRARRGGHAHTQAKAPMPCVVRARLCCAGRCQQHHHGSRRSEDCDRHGNYFPSLHGTGCDGARNGYRQAARQGRSPAHPWVRYFPLHRGLQSDAGQNDHVMGLP